MKNRVEGYNSVFKDETSGLITNNNTSDRERYRIAKENARKNIESRDEIKELREEVNDLKSLIKDLINKI